MVVLFFSKVVRNPHKFSYYLPRGSDFFDIVTSSVICYIRWELKWLVNIHIFYVLFHEAWKNSGVATFHVNTHTHTHCTQRNIFFFTVSPFHSALSPLCSHEKSNAISNVIKNDYVFFYAIVMIIFCTIQHYWCWWGYIIITWDIFRPLASPFHSVSTHIRRKGKEIYLFLFFKMDLWCNENQFPSITPHIFCFLVQKNHMKTLEYSF